jgi:hypothetical protein
MKKGKAVSKANAGPRASWFKLDNAAILFPTVASESITTLFRMQITLRSPINVTMLQEALDAIHPRYPYFLVRLRSGLFWYYFELIGKKPLLMADSRYPNQNIRIKKGGGFLFRVRAYRDRIAVEFSHILTDGSGAMRFLRSLVAEYLRLKEGIELGDDELRDASIDRPGSPVPAEEFEDAFRRYYDPSVPSPDPMPPAFHIPGTFEKNGIYHVTTAILPLKASLAKAKEKGATLTELLCAVYLASLQEMWLASRKPKSPFLRLMVPVNLRKLFPSVTMRNFSLYVIPGIDMRLGRYEFDEILGLVVHYMRSNVNKKELSRQIQRNVSGAMNPLIRMMPLFIKKPGGQFLYRKFGENLYSGCISNLGSADLPGALASFAEKIEFIPTGTPVTKTNVAVVSFGDSLYVSFGSLLKERELERLFITRLVKLGLKARVESND